jgi:hypothetical protein
MIMLPLPLLQELICLDESAGRLTWKARGLHLFSDRAKSARHGQMKWNTRYAGTEAIAAISSGYKRGNILGLPHQYHHVVFALHNGRLPSGIVDHRDLDTLNNRPDNLREASRAQNGANCLARSGGTSPFKGVSWCSTREKWKAQIGNGSGRSRHIGMFASEADAAKAYDLEALKSYGAFARLNFPQDALQ